MFIGWNAGGKAHRNLSLNAAPIDVADFLRRRLFESDTSIVMTSATLATNSKSQTGLNYFSKRVGCESATMLQVGTPFDYARQMKLFAVKKMPDPREAGYRDALIHWIGHFRTQTHGKAFVLFTNYKLMQEVAELMQPFFGQARRRVFCAGHWHAALDDAGEVQAMTRTRCSSARTASGRAWTCRARR